MAQEYYNEYLKLKEEVSYLINSRTHVLNQEEILNIHQKIDSKVERLRFILYQLKETHGVAMEDLILLSIGVEM